MKRVSDKKMSGFRYMIAILPVLLTMTAIFFFAVSDEIERLSEEKYSIRSRNYAYDITTWTESVLYELEIYRGIALREGGFDEHTLKILATSAGKNPAYPYGIYWGDEDDNYFDSSGWEPDEEFIPSQRVWYKEGLLHSDFAFGEPYIDQMTGESCVSATAKMDLNGKVSVIAADIYFDYTSEVLRGVTGDDFDSAFFVSRRDRVIIGASDTSLVGMPLKSKEGPLLNQKIDALIAEEFAGQTTLKADGTTYYVNIYKMDTTGWYFVTCINKSSLLSELYAAEVIMALISSVAAAALITFVLLYSRRMMKVLKSARTDPLTKLLNRNSLRSNCAAEMDENPGQGVLLIFDMDNFKQINDHLGHPEGDKVLKTFAELLTGYFNRNGDICARLGGDEFSVFLSRRVRRADVYTMLTRFLALFHEKFDPLYSAQELSVSIGAAFVSDIGSSFEELYAEADNALYQAKQGGKNTFFVA